MPNKSRRRNNTKKTLSTVKKVRKSLRTKRRSLKKEKREALWIEMDKRCGYCGSEIEYNELQIDHMDSLASGGDHEDENLMPSCRVCNHYKRCLNPQQFKKRLQGLKKRIESLYIVKVALRYGIVTTNDFKKEFYYETKNT